MKIEAKKITNENFEQYGKVLLNPKGEPTAKGSDFKFWSDIVNYEIDGSTEIGLCKVYKQNENLLNVMEHHKCTPEILIPIDAPFVLPLLYGDDSSDKAKAFIVDQGEAVVIDKGVWHGACLPVGKEEASYFVIFRKGTPLNDVYKKQIDEILVQF